MRTLVAILALGATWLASQCVVDAHPMIVEVPEEGERCIRLTIPEEDDAHVVFLAIPGQDAEEDSENQDWAQEQAELEEYFVHQMTEMQKYRVRTALPRKFPDQPPERIAKLMSKFLGQYDGEMKAFCKISISGEESAASREMESFWFNPLVVNHIRKSIRGGDSSAPLEGYEICFLNSNEDSPVQIVVESVLTSDPDLGEDDDAPVSFESSNLTPLAEQLNEGISSANSVLTEMRCMEGRERRMRQTADSINTRVKYFSYVSVTVLILVTYVQVSYLKRYFRKKKLL